MDVDVVVVADCCDGDDADDADDTDDVISAAVVDAYEEFRAGIDGIYDGDANILVIL